MYQDKNRRDYNELRGGVQIILISYPTILIEERAIIASKKDRIKQPISRTHTNLPAHHHSENNCMRLEKNHIQIKSAN